MEQWLLSSFTTKSHVFVLLTVVIIDFLIHWQQVDRKRRSSYLRRGELASRFILGNELLSLGIDIFRTSRRVLLVLVPRELASVNFMLRANKVLFRNFKAQSFVKAPLV